MICPTTTIKLLSTLRISTSSIIATTLLIQEPSVTVNTSSKPTVATSSQSQLALFGSVGAALAVGAVAVVALLLVVVVVLIRRKKNKTVTSKGTVHLIKLRKSCNYNSSVLAIYYNRMDYFLKFFSSSL